MKEEKRIDLSIHVHLIKQIYDYDSKKLQWNSVSFILGRTVSPLRTGRYKLLNSKHTTHSLQHKNYDKIMMDPSVIASRMIEYEEECLNSLMRVAE